MQASIKLHDTSKYISRVKIASLDNSERKVHFTRAKSYSSDSAVTSEMSHEEIHERQEAENQI